MVLWYELLHQWRKMFNIWWPLELRRQCLQYLHVLLQLNYPVIAGDWPLLDGPRWMKKGTEISRSKLRCKQFTNAPYDQQTQRYWKCHWQTELCYRVPQTIKQFLWDLGLPLMPPHSPIFYRDKNVFIRMISPVATQQSHSLCLEVQYFFIKIKS